MFRIVKHSTVHAYAARYPQALKGLETWLMITEGATWNSLDAVRTVFPHADQVIVGSGRPVVVFNIAGNKYRLIAGMHFNMKVVYVLRFMTHAEYDKEQWKDQL